MRYLLTLIIGGIRYELRDTQEQGLELNSSLSDVPSTSIIYLKVSPPLFSPPPPNLPHPQRGLTTPVDTLNIPRHVPPILPDGLPYPETLSLPARTFLPADGQVRPAHQPQEPVQSAVYHVTSEEVRYHGNVGCCQLAREEREEATYTGDEWEESGAVPAGKG